MRKNILILLTIIFASLTLSCSDSTIVDPGGNKVYQLTKATSNGDSWQQVYSLPTKIGVHSVRLNDLSSDGTGNIFAATSGGGIYKIKSSDSSAVQYTSGLIDLNIDTSTKLYFVGAVLAEGGKIIAGASDLHNTGGIFTTTSQSFQSKLTFNQYSNVVALYKNPNGEIYAGCYEDIFKSSDGGNSWTNLSGNTEAGFGYFYSFAFDKYGNTYGATAHGVEYSESQKEQFKNIGLPDQTILSIDLNSQEWIYASAGQKMFVSEDKGVTWKQLNNFPVLTAHCIYINQNDIIFAGTEDGIYRSKDNGQTWEFIGLKNEMIIRIISDGNGNLVAGTYMNKIYKSSL